MLGVAAGEAGRLNYLVDIGMLAELVILVILLFRSALFALEKVIAVFDTGRIDRLYDNIIMPSGNDLGVFIAAGS